MGWLWDVYRMIMGWFWDDYGMIMGWFWGDYGVILRWLWGHFRWVYDDFFDFSGWPPGTPGLKPYWFGGSIKRFSRFPGRRNDKKIKSISDPENLHAAVKTHYQKGSKNYKIINFWPKNYDFVIFLMPSGNVFLRPHANSQGLKWT